MTAMASIALLAVTATSLNAQEKRIPRAEALKAVTNRVEPSYPPVARQMKMEGNVEVDAQVAEDGTVQSVKTVTGNPVLAKAAENAVKQWKFTPFKEEGKPTKAVVGLVFSFKL